MQSKFTVGVLLAVAGLGQPRLSGPEFEVASVKATAATVREASEAGRAIGLRVNGTRVEIASGSLTYLIAIACRVERNRVSGPDWMVSQRFDIQAKIPEGASQEQVPEMLQALLAERFNLRFHREPRQLDVYSLLVGIEGPKMKEASADGKSAQPTTAGPGKRVRLIVMQNDFGGANTVSVLNGYRTVFEGERVTMHDLGSALQRYLDKPLVDKTGLRGEYEIALEVPRRGIRAGGLGDPGVASPDSISSEPDVSIFSTIKSLGLRLEQQKTTFDYIVVDHLEKAPAPN